MQKSNPIENSSGVNLNNNLTPENPLGNFRITNIFNTAQLQKIQDVFAFSYNITSVITDIEGRPITRPSNISPVCQLVRNTLKGRKLCELSDKNIGKMVHETLKPYSTKCLSCGFVETGAPIIVADTHIANWIIGQGINKNIDETRLNLTADQFKIDRNLFLEAYKNTHFVKSVHFDKIIDFLWVMAEYISTLGYNNIILARDVEERKKVEEELIRAKDMAEESDRLKSAFLANMSHAIRTPMNGIVGFANILNEEDLLPENRKEYIEIINQNATLLLKLIDDILDIAKMEANQLTIDEKPCYLDQLLQDILHNFKDQLDNDNSVEIELSLKLPEYRLDKLIYIDNIRFKQVLNNLLSNAIKFTRKGKVEFGYDIELPFQLKFFVKDTGIGISNEKRFIIFDRFRQVDERTSKNYSGTGLGLALAKNLVKLMNGTIWVESEVGKGATFCFTLPYKPFNDNEIIKTSIYDGIDLSEDFSNKQILIAEDEQLNFHLLYEILKSTGAKIIHAYNGQEAIDIYIKNSSIDLILLDINMPVMDGFKTINEIRSISHDIRVIALTDNMSTEEKNRCSFAGYNNYISKHISPEIFLNIIRSYLYKIDSVVE